MIDNDLGINFLKSKYKKNVDIHLY